MVRDTGKRYDDCTWRERGRYNHWDADEGMWRNDNMIWIAPLVMFIVAGSIGCIIIAVLQ